MSAAALEREPMAIMISGQLQRDIESKAAEMAVSVEQAAHALLRIGLEEQRKREAELATLIERYRESPSDSGLANQVGEALFGS